MPRSGSVLLPRWRWRQTEGSSTSDDVPKTGQYQCTPGWGEWGRWTGSQRCTHAPLPNILNIMFTELTVYPHFGARRRARVNKDLVTCPDYWSIVVSFSDQPFHIWHETINEMFLIWRSSQAFNCLLLIRTSYLHLDSREPNLLLLKSGLWEMNSRRRLVE